MTLMTRLLAVAGLVLLVFTGCSKENLDVPVSENPVINASRISPGYDIFQTSGITGHISPASAKAKITVFDSQGRAFGPYYTDRATGNFKIGGLLAGTYKLAVEYPVPSNDAFDPTYVYALYSQEVQIKGGVVTDVGIIKLN